MAVATARMYAVAPGAAAAWRRLLGAVIEASGVEMEIIDHAYPAPLAALWDREDLGCAFMCGWPFVREGGVKTLLGAPIPLDEWAEGRAVYRSEFVVAAGSAFASLPDTFRHRFAFNARDSQSGYNAPRAHLSAFAERSPLFGAVVGPFVTPRRTVEAVVGGEAEVTAVDSLVLALLRRHEPGLMREVRVVDVTAPCPAPPLVASGVSAGEASRVRGALLGLADTASGREFLADVCLRGFAVVERDAYEATQVMERIAVARSYPAIA